MYNSPIKRLLVKWKEAIPMRSIERMKKVHFQHLG